MKDGSPQRRLNFVQYDAFTSTPLEGNPLAVFPDADGLNDDEMQAIAREMNLSETTFVFRRGPELERERGIRVRIFAVQEELPFAGHPTLGTAFALRGQTGATDIKLELNVGTIPVRFEDAAGKPAFGEMTQLDPTFGEVLDRNKIAEIAGVPVEDIDSELPVQTVSTGVPFTIVPLRNLAAIGNIAPKQPLTSEQARGMGSKFLFFVTRETVFPEAKLHARMLMQGAEDPATGSASGCAAAWMVKHGLAQSGERVLIEQGIEMKRPSRIFVRASRHNDRVVNVCVGGNVVEVLRGELFF